MTKEAMREALRYLLDASDGAQSGYISGSGSDLEWRKRFEDAKSEATTALQQSTEVKV